MVGGPGGRAPKAGALTPGGLGPGSPFAVGGAKPADQGAQFELF